MDIKKTARYSLIFILLMIFCKNLSKEAEFMNNGKNDIFTKKRLKMVNEQIIYRGINDNLVINAMKKVKRHKFVPKKYLSQAYNDEPLPIGYNQTISQPYIVAYMTEVLSLKKNEKILEIGTGSGYQAAVLAEIGCEVYTIEIIKELAVRSKKILKSIGYKNIHFKYGDGYNGWPEMAPFDAIIVTAAPPDIPEALVNQLKPFGRMILPKGSFSQKLILVSKSGKKITLKNLLPVRFVPMVKSDQK